MRLLNDVAEVLVSKGAQVLVSPVSWGPGGCGPDGEWEARSAQTGLPIIVCNRTGREPDYYIHETDHWLVFPHELHGLTRDEIIRNKLGIGPFAPRL